MIARIANQLSGSGHVAVGAASPLPAAASLVAQTLQPELRVSLLGSEKESIFTDGGRELFDCAAQGRIDAFFLSGVQIDGYANINLVGVGDYPQLKRRYAGSFGSAFLYHHVPNVILFCWAHSPKTLVEKVDFISAAGPRRDGIWRRGAPSMLITDRCEFRWVSHADNNDINSSDASDASETGNAGPSGQFVLEALHPGESLDALTGQTGFRFAERDDDVSANASDMQSSTEAQDKAYLNEIEKILQLTVLPSLEKTYPQFVKRFYT